MPLDFLLRLMRDPQSPIARRLDAARAAAPFLDPKLCAVEPKPSPAAPEPPPERTSFVCGVYRARRAPRPRWHLNLVLGIIDRQVH
jgi:hypothetical protein